MNRGQSLNELGNADGILLQNVDWQKVRGKRFRKSIRFYTVGSRRLSRINKILLTGLIHDNSGEDGSQIRM